MQKNTASIYKILDSLLTLIEQSPAVPFSDQKMVSMQKAKKILHYAINNLPQQMMEAEEIIRRQEYLVTSAQNRSDEIINQAMEQRDSIIRNAENKRQELIDDSEILRIVKFEAENLKKQTKVEIEEAFREAEKRIVYSENKARQEIYKILTEAEEEAKKIKQNAYEYANYILSQMEVFSDKTLNLIKEGKYQLEQIHTDQKPETPQTTPINLTEPTHNHAQKTSAVDEDFELTEERKEEFFDLHGS